MTDIIEDINGEIDDSELLHHLLNNDISQDDAIEFGQQMIYLLTEGH